MTEPLKPGDRVRLIAMPHDPDPIPAGSLGTVRAIWDHDDWSQIDVVWDNGRQLMLCLPEDSVALVCRASKSECGSTEEP